MKRTARRVLCTICAAILFLSAIVVPAQPARAEVDGLDLTEMQIVLPEKPTKLENTAASELKKYVFNMTGKNVRTVKEGENSGPGIYLGNTRYAKDKGVAYPTENDPNGEAWAIAAVEGNLVLCGAPQRGPLYAVYHLLEDVLGVRWWNPWEEEVPYGSAIVPADYADSGVPAMEYREVFIGSVPRQDEAFYARNRMNGGLLPLTTTYGGKEAYGSPAHTHTFNLYFPKDYQDTDSWLSTISDTKEDFDSNPEWFAMDTSGQRVYNGHLCLTNPDLQKEFSSRVIGSIAFSYSYADTYGEERQNYFAVVPPDSSEFCHCPQCLAKVEQYGLSGYILNFVNQVAADVAAAGYREAIIEMAAYASYRDVPLGGIVPAENVQVRFCDSGKDILHGLNHPNNAPTLERLKGWAEITTNNLYNWQYVVNYNNNGVFPNMFYFGEEMVTMAELGVNGWFAEQEQCINVDFWDMKLWLLAKLMEKPVTGAEYEALMDEFIFGYYGDEAGQYIRQYLYYMHEKAEATDAYQTFGTHIIDTEWLTVQDIITGNEFFEKAFAAGTGDATLMRRLRRARSGLDRVILENFGKWQSQAAEAGLTLPFTKRQVGIRINRTFTEQIDLRGDHDIDYKMFCYRYDMYVDHIPGLPAELSDVPEENIVVFDPNDFRMNYGDYVTEDSDSPIGKAIRSDGGSRLASGNNSLILSGARGITLNIYDPEKKSPSEQLWIGTINAEDIKADQGYQLYTLEWKVAPASGRSYLYIFDDWGLQNVQLPTQVQDWVGQTVKICISMKVEGVVDGSDPNNYPVYYIDRVFVVTPEESGGEEPTTDPNADVPDTPDTNDVPQTDYSIILLAAGALLLAAAFMLLVIVVKQNRK